MTPQILPTRIDLFKALPRGAVVAEVGVWRGYLSTEILNTCPNVAKLFCVDPWRGQTGNYQDRDKTQAEHDADMAQAQHHLRGWLNCQRVEIIRARSVEAALLNATPLLDGVYADGDHSYSGCLEDLIQWSKRLKPGGVLMGHDFKEDGDAAKWGFGVVRAVREFCREYGWRISHLTAEDFASYRLEQLPA